MERIRALTHSGTFHADEVTAYAVLALAEPETVPRHFTRSRDPEVVARAEIVFDVGGVFDPSRHRYDHHMRERPLRADGTPYSSAGLIWAAFGRDALRTLVPDAPDGLRERLWAAMDREFILPTDRIDNGIGEADGLSYAGLIADINPAWDDTAPDENARFLEAARLADAALRRKVAALLARLRAEDAVLAAAAAAADPRVLELPASMPWQEAAFEHGLPVLFAVYPSRPGTWRIDCMRPEPGSFGQRLPLPEAWAGLSGEALQRACGIADAGFVHPARFTGGAASREGVLAMARQALAHA
ncbi:MYG1 family protein [Arenibaculum sp.]|jgi:uncharacterized UPF0160 family protein|uniref:MYG1 family protein n=1 Tax=Arenibaculum sp. TaxID=2865862 RepID=UPI002E0F5775|nr:MYG1 family protein [Arenibaculum sp.]